MAWYALYLWSKPWRKKPMYSWVRWYKYKLYQDWYNSLFDEDKVLWDKMVEEDKRKREKEAKDSIGRILYMYNMLTSKTDSMYLRSPKLLRDIYK